MSLIITFSWLFALILVCSLAATALMIRLAPRIGMVDHPGERRIHKQVIPRAGGVAVFACLAVGFGILAFLGKGFTGGLDGGWLACFMIAAGLLLAVGIMDDRKGMSAWIKLGVQCLASVIMYLHRGDAGGAIFGLEIPWFVDLAVHVGWYVVLINAFNLIDGMDGLCAGLAMISLTILSVLCYAGPHPENILVTGVMIAALGGFLRYNFHPARIFLGDSGSMVIGFFIASVGVATVGRNAVVGGLMLPLLLAGVPLFDVFLAIWRRVARRIAVSRPGQAAIRVFDPDRDHLHHRLLHWGLTQRQAALVMYGLALVSALIALIPLIGGENMLAISLVGVVLIAVIGLRYIAPIEFQHTGEGLRAVVRQPQGFKRTVAAGFFIDLVCSTAAAFASSWILTKTLREEWTAGKDITMICILVACVMIGLRCGHAHTRRWMRASKYDFVEVSIWVACGITMSFAVQGVAHGDFSFRILVFHGLACSMIMPLIFIPRSISLTLQEGVIDSMHRKRRMKSKRASRTILLYGAGDLGELFLNYLRLSSPQIWEDDHFVGFIDDTPGLRRRRMSGFFIFGGVDDLPDIIARTGANCILITASTLSVEAQERLYSAGESLGLEIRRWLPDLQPEVLFSPVAHAAGSLSVESGRAPAGFPGEDREGDEAAGGLADDEGARPVAG